MRFDEFDDLMRDRMLFMAKYAPELLKLRAYCPSLRSRRVPDPNNITASAIVLWAAQDRIILVN
jgi:hypothetical protein